MKYHYLFDGNGRIQQISETPFQAAILLEEPTQDFPLWNGSEWIPDEKRIKQNRTNILSALADTDAGMTRAIEDLISLLISKKVISEEELPQIVKDKLTTRNDLRNKL